VKDENEIIYDQLPVGLLAQLVRALHRYRRGFLFTTAKVASITAMIILAFNYVNTVI